jgi:hypothetical protein
MDIQNKVKELLEKSVRTKVPVEQVGLEDDFI